MRDHFAVDWAFGVRGAIENIVRTSFPQDLRSWPLLQAFNFEAYELPQGYMALILKDKLSGIPAGPGVCAPFPHVDYPDLPPKSAEIELWQFYLRGKFSLREEDAPFIIPMKDSGKNSAVKDYELFSADEQFFWNQQINCVVARFKAHLQSMNKQAPVQPTHITYNVGGTSARVNINSADSSVNVVSTKASEVFSQTRETISKISDAKARADLEQVASEMEASYGTDTFLAKYQSFITSAANHMTLLAPILPALAGLLT